MSFWSTLGSGLGSLVPGIGPFLGPAIGLGLGAAFGSGSGSPTSGGDTTASLNGQINDVMSGGGSPQTRQAGNYYTKILNGDRTATEALLRPQVSTVLGQYDNAAKAAAELGPRGGGRTETLAELPTKKVGVYENALEGAQPEAAKGLVGIGTQNNSLLSSLLGARSSSNELGFQQSKEVNGQLGNLGSGIGSILVNLLKGRGKTSPSSSPGSSPGGSFGDAGAE